VCQVRGRPALFDPDALLAMDAKRIFKVLDGPFLITLPQAMLEVKICDGQIVERLGAFHGVSDLRTFLK